MNEKQSCTLKFVLCGCGTGHSFGAAAPPNVPRNLPQQQQGLQELTNSHKHLSQAEHMVGPEARPSTEVPVDQAQLYARQYLPRQLPSGPLPTGLLQAGQPQSGRSVSGLLPAGQPQSGQFQPGQPMAQQWSRPWMQTLESMHAPHKSDQQMVDQAWSFKPAQHAQHANPDSESCIPAEDVSMLPSQSDAFDANRSVSQFSAVQQAQLWIAQQQQQRKQQQLQQQQQQQHSPMDSLSDCAAETRTVTKHADRSASAFPDRLAGSSAPGNALADERLKAQAVHAPASAQHVKDSQVPVRLEARSNSTDAIMEAQRRTMAFLAARDPKRPPWGQMGDQAAVNNRYASSFVRQSSSLTGAKAPSWGQMGVQPGKGSGAPSAAPSSSSGRQAPSLESLMLPQSSLPSSSWKSSMQIGEAQSPTERMQPQALADAVKVRHSTYNPF